jgi:ribosomal-protein-alanine N-acetyltransferase
VLTGPSALTARGARVHVRPVSVDDVEPFREAITASAERIGRWNPVDPGLVGFDLTQQSASRRTFMVLANDPAGSHGLVGRVNISNIVHRVFRSGSMGYDAYDPYAGTGMFGEGLRLVVDLALRPAEDGGLGLHRVEANVQPGNAASAGVLRSLGFRHEGETPRMLLLGGPDGTRWRDHERYAVTSEDWPAAPYAPHGRARRVVLVNGVPGAGTSALAAALAAELALPLLPQGALSGAVGGGLPDDAMWTLLAGCPTGAVLEGCWGPGDGAALDGGLARAAVPPVAAVEVRVGRVRGLADDASLVGGPLVPVEALDGDHAPSPRDVARLALAVRARAVLG